MLLVPGIVELTCGCHLSTSAACSSLVYCKRMDQDITMYCAKADES